MVTQQILVLSFQVRALAGLFSDPRTVANSPAEPRKTLSFAGFFFLRFLQFR